MAGLAAAGIGAATSLFNGITGKNAAKKATAAQTANLDKALGQQQAQFDTTRGDFMPFLQGGQGALSEIEKLLGLGGGPQMPGSMGGYGSGTFNPDGSVATTRASEQSDSDLQAAAIARLKASPAFTSLYGTGQDTILQNANATGGLRGGNNQNSLAQFGSGLLATVIQNQLSNLGGLVNVGAGAAGNLGQFGQANSSAVSNLLTQRGNAEATGILGRQTIQNNTTNDLSKLLQGVKW